MHIIAATFVVFLASLLQPSTPASNTPADDTAWNKLHPTTQEYLEENAKFYVVNDAGQLWSRKIFMQDKASMPTPISSMNKLKLEARASKDAPAWYCLENDIRISASPDSSWLVDYKMNYASFIGRETSIERYGDEYYQFFFLWDVSDDGLYFRGRLHDEDDNSLEVAIAGWDILKNHVRGDGILVPYLAAPLGSTTEWLVNDGPQSKLIALPVYFLSVLDGLDQEYPILELNNKNFPPLTPHQLASEIIDRNLDSLPEWRFRSKPNRDHKEWLRDKQGNEPAEHLFIWTKKPVRIRFKD